MADEKPEYEVEVYCPFGLRSNRLRVWELAEEHGGRPIMDIQAHDCLAIGFYQQMAESHAKCFFHEVKGLEFVTDVKSYKISKEPVDFLN